MPNHSGSHDIRVLCAFADTGEVSQQIERWEARLKSSGTLDYHKPGPGQALHAIMPQERQWLKEFAGREETADYSFQMLAIKGAEYGLFFMSASSVRLILPREEGMGDDRRGRRTGGSGAKPNRPEELSRGQNQCWCWDMSYLKTDVLRRFWYLYVLLDEWSRKVIAWRVSHSLSHEEGIGLLDDGIIAEKLLDVPREQRPVVVNDNGVQMKAKPVKQMFVDLGIEQTFFRPRTPEMTTRLWSHCSAASRPVRPIRVGFLMMMNRLYSSILKNVFSGITMSIIIHGSNMLHLLRSTRDRLRGL